MRWPWIKAPENRGTLTFLPDGQIIFGFPANEPPTAEAMAHFREYLSRWLRDDTKMLVLPFPVDVVDRR